MAKQCTKCRGVFRDYEKIIFSPLKLKLTHISLASFLWDIGKQNRPRCDSAFWGVPSGAILFAHKKFIEK